jgi:hypothetical protein
MFVIFFEREEKLIWWNEGKIQHKFTPPPTHTPTPSPQPTPAESESVVVLTQL